MLRRCLLGIALAFALQNGTKAWPEDAVDEGVGLHEALGLQLRLEVGDWLAVLEDVGEGVLDAVGVGLAEHVAVRVGDAVGLPLGLRVTVELADGVALDVALLDGVIVVDDVGVGVDAGILFPTPMPHCSPNAGT